MSSLEAIQASTNELSNFHFFLDSLVVSKATLRRTRLPSKRPKIALFGVNLLERPDSALITALPSLGSAGTFGVGYPDSDIKSHLAKPVDLHEEDLAYPDSVSHPMVRWNIKWRSMAKPSPLLHNCKH